MEIQQINRTDAEKVYINVTNVDAASITTGYAVAYALVGDSVNGVNVVKTASAVTANLPGFIGIAAADFAANAVGRVQIFGMVDSVFLSRTNTSVTINIGDPMVPGAAAGGLFSLAPTYAASGFKYLSMTSVATIGAAVGNTSLAVTAAYTSGIISHI